MRTVWIIALALMLSLVATPAKADLHAWLMGSSDFDSPDNEYLARVGICNGDDNGDVEFGIQSHWLGTHGKNQSYGAYALLHLFGDQADWMGQPYIGFHASVVSGSDSGNGMYGPIAGTIYGKIFVVEYQYRTFTGRLSELVGPSNEEHKVFAGIRIGF